MSLVASHEPILLPFSTPQTHTLPSADTKVTQAANNKQRLVVRPTHVAELLSAPPRRLDLTRDFGRALIRKIT
jgi:hypothetical protein